MNIIDIINKKRLNEDLTNEEINYAVKGYVDGSILDYQMSSLLMAICINGMNEKEVIALTDCMLKSGKIIDLSDIDGVFVDKHSTGGIGDKTTLILAPIVASCGVNMLKMSGRGLGHTGGTIDKLESILGFKTDISIDLAKKQVKEIGVAIISQQEDLVLADKKMYALRDVSGTVSSIPLIASSVMSKKLASGANKFVIEVTYGSGALLKSEDEAILLSNLMIKIGKHYNKQVVCILTDMSTPLGYSIGNGLEVIESIDALKGNCSHDLEEIVILLSTLLVSIGKNINEETARIEVVDSINSGKAYDKFKELVSMQGGDIESISISSKVVSIKSSKIGIINNIDALKIGKIASKLGAGRLTKEDIINHGVGIVLNKKIGDMVIEGEELAKVYLGDVDINVSEVIDCFEIDDEMPKPKRVVSKIIR